VVCYYDLRICPLVADLQPTASVTVTTVGIDQQPVFGITARV